MEKRDLMSVMQSPLIYYKLEDLSVEIKEKVENINKLVVNDETYKEVKKARTELKKEFEEFENQRKFIKNQILGPYQEFEEEYKKYVSNIYKNADSELKEKINNVENQLKEVKETELREFAEQYFVKYKIDNFVNYEQMGIKINLSSSMKSLKEQVLSWCNNIKKDLTIIEQMPEKEEVLWEYKNSYNFMNNCYELDKAIKVVRDRKEALEIYKKEKVEEEKQEEITQEMVSKVEEVVEELTPPEPIEKTTLEDSEERFILSFTVEGTMNQLRKLKEFMKEEGIEYNG